MKKNNSESSVNTIESNFSEFMQRGDDFYKIELLRQAEGWYEKALNINPENEKAQYFISECKRKLAFESKVVYILITLALAIVLVYYLII